MLPYLTVTESPKNVRLARTRSGRRLEESQTPATSLLQREKMDMVPSVEGAGWVHFSQVCSTKKLRLLPLMAAAGGPLAPNTGRIKSQVSTATGMMEKPFPPVIRILMRMQTEVVTAISLRHSSFLSKEVLLPCLTVLVRQPLAEARGVFVFVTNSVCHLDLVSLQELSCPGPWPKGLQGSPLWAPVTPLR